MALPYTVTMTISGLAVYILLQPLTQAYYAEGLLTHHATIVAERPPDHGSPAPPAGFDLSK